MNDAEGLRNLVGTGLIEFGGGLLTAVLAFALMLRLSPGLTLVTLLALVLFGGVLWRALGSLRPVFRERGRIYGEVYGRLSESLSGIRVVKGYHAEARESAVFAQGVGRLLENVRRTLDSTSLLSLASSVLLGLVGGAVIVGGRARGPAGQPDAGRPVHVHGAAPGFLVAPWSRWWRSGRS